MLEVQHLKVDAPDGEGRTILNDINLKAEDGKLLVLTGPNGGGKSTLAKTVAGILRPSAGRILLDGRDITSLGITERARMGVAFAFQQPVRFKGLTVRDLLTLAAGGVLSEDVIYSYLRDVGLCAHDYIDREIGSSLSGGEIKRIEIATVIARQAKLTLFDEPEAGIDLWSFNNLIDVFRTLKQRLAGAVIVISHQERILEVADEIGVLADGKIVAYGQAREILPDLLKAGADCSFCCRDDVVSGPDNDGILRRKCGL